MTAREALAFIRKRGVVLESARGPVPSLAQVIAGEPVRGSWWSHPKSREIFAVTRAVRDSDNVLVCRLIDGKITFVHRRLWPALVRVADRLPAVCLSQLREVHARSGRHVTTEVPFPLGSVERPGRSSKSLGGRGARSVRLDRIKEEALPNAARRMRIASERCGGRGGRRATRGPPVTDVRPRAGARVQNRRMSGPSGAGVRCHAHFGMD